MNLFRASENLQWGVRAFHTGSLNQAIMYFEKALSYKSGDVDSRIWLGRSFYKSGLEEAGLSEWNSVLRRGKGSRLLESAVSVIASRRGLSRDLFEDSRYVISSVIDGARKNYVSFRRPTSVKSRREGGVYIVAFGTNEVVSVDANNTVSGIYRGGLEGFDHPFDILRTEDGFLFVSEYEGNRISKCDLSGRKMKSFGKRGTRDGELLGPQFLDTDNKGYIYVTDYGNKRISKFDTEGGYVLSFGEKTADYAGLSGPTGIGINGERVYVSDNAARRIDVFDTSGNFIETLGKGFLKGPEGLMFIQGRTLYVADSQAFDSKTRICKLDLENEKWSVFTDLGGQGEKLLSVTVDPNGDLYACDYNLNKVFIVSEVSDLYSGLFVQIEKIDSSSFPEITADISCEDRFGNPVIGLKRENFAITEHMSPVTGVSMFEPINTTERLKLVVLVEKSGKIARYEKDVTEAASRIMELAGGAGNVIIVTASESPVLEANAEGTKLAKLEALSSGGYSQAWRFDIAARLSVSSLLQYRTKRAVIFLAEGTLEEGRHFADYSPSETVQYMKNNFVSFNTVAFGKDRLADEIAFVTEKTGGKVYSYRDPGGIESIIKDISMLNDPRYIFKYRSRADSKFGMEQIKVEVEARFRSRSGRDESGYYGPIR